MNLSSINENSQKSEILFELAAILGQQNDFQEILRIVSAKTTTLFNADIVSILPIMSFLA